MTGNVPAGARWLERLRHRLRQHRLHPHQRQRRRAARVLERFDFAEEFRWPLLRALRRSFPHLRFLVGEAGGGLYAVSPEDDTIGFSLLQGEAFERDTFLRALQRLQEHQPAIGFQGRVFVDIGANVGFMAVYAAQSGCFKRALCIEPDPVNFRLLKATMALNDLESFARLVPMAAGDHEGEAVFELAQSNFGDHRIRMGTGNAGNAYGEANRSTTRVRLTTLDSLLAQEGLQPADLGLVWIDTQGHEGFVLAGGTALGHGVVPAVCEFWPYGMKRSGGWDHFRGAVLRWFKAYYDLSEPAALTHPMGELDALFARLGADTAHTDLLFVPR